MLQILAHTPTWVFFLLITLLFLGYRQSKNREIGAYPVFIMPIIFISLGLSGTLQQQWLCTVVFIMSVALGVLLSFRMSSITSIVKVTAKHVYIPGSWIPMLCIVVIFLARYSLNVLTVTKPELLASWSFILPYALSTGFFGGYFVARAIKVIRLYKFSKEENIPAT